MRNTYGYINRQGEDPWEDREKDCWRNKGGTGIVPLVCINPVMKKKRLSDNGDQCYSVPTTREILMRCTTVCQLIVSLVTRVLWFALFTAQLVRVCCSYCRHGMQSTVEFIKLNINSIAVYILSQNSREFKNTCGHHM